MAISKEQRDAAESEGANEARTSWREVDPTAFRMAIDDIRQKVVEEGFFGRPVTDQIADVRAVADDPGLQVSDKELEREELYGRDIEQEEVEADGPNIQGEEAEL